MSQVKVTGNRTNYHSRGAAESEADLGLGSSIPTTGSIPRDWTTLEYISKYVLLVKLNIAGDFIKWTNLEAVGCQWSSLVRS